MARAWKPSIEDYDKCNRQARREGIFAGATASLLGAVFGQRIFKFDRRTTLVTGLFTGVLSGYYFSQAFLSSHLAELRQQIVYQDSLAAAPNDENKAPFDSPSYPPSGGADGVTRVV